MLAVLTFAVSAVILLAGWGEEMAVRAGMIPATVGLPIVPGLLPWWITPLSATLVHGGWLHLAFNLVVLVYCGKLTERSIGSGATTFLYIIGAYAAAVGNWLPDPYSMTPTVGASGAASAFVAATAVFYGQPRTRAIGPVPARLLHVLWVAAAWIVIQLLVGVAGGAGLAGSGNVAIAVGAHIGGFLAGLVLARPLLLWRYRRA